MSLTLPRVLRIAQNPDFMEVYIQPTFTVFEKTDITSVVTSVHLDLIPPPQTSHPTPYLYGGDVVEFTDAQTGTGRLAGKYLSDPAPFAVTQDKPQALMLRFYGPSGSLIAGRWHGALTAERQGQPSLRDNFCVDLSVFNISFFSSTTNLLTLRNDQSLQSLNSKQTPNCYRSP